MIRMDYLSASRSWREQAAKAGKPIPWWMAEAADTPEPLYDPIEPRGVAGIVPSPARGQSD